MSARLLLDEMYPPEIGEQLSKRGHDVIAVVASALKEWSDEQLLVYATGNSRCLVSENTKDFELARMAWGDTRPPAGLVYTSPKRYPRGRRHWGALIMALDRMITGGQLPGPGEVRWLR